MPTINLPGRGGYVGFKGVHDTIIFANNNEVYLSGGANNTIVGGAHEDFFYLAGERGSLALGLDGKDFISVSGKGSVGNGGAGDDTLIGGAGAKLVGGKDADTFRITNNYGDGTVKIADFRPGQGDKLDVSELGSWSPIWDFMPAALHVDGNRLDADWKDAYGNFHTMEVIGVGNAITAVGGIEAAVKAGWLVTDHSGGGKGALPAVSHI